MLNILDEFEKKRNFTEEEAWKIFKIIAFSEAFGWTCLISGLTLSHFHIVNKNIAIPIAGQIHGTIFIAYFLILIFVYPSLKWKRSTFILGLVAGVLPYGSIVFELMLNQSRKKVPKIETKAVLIIELNNKIIAVQPSHGIDWVLPSINVQQNQSPKKAAHELVKTMFNQNVNLIKQKTIYKNNVAHNYYKVVNPKNIFKLNLFNISKNLPLIDDIDAIDISRIKLPYA